jgi:hypothetical protein
VNIDDPSEPQQGTLPTRVRERGLCLGGGESSGAAAGSLSGDLSGSVWSGTVSTALDAGWSGAVAECARPFRR